MARVHVEGLPFRQKVVLGLQIQASGEGKVARATLRSGMLVAAVQNKFMAKGGL